MEDKKDFDVIVSHLDDNTDVATVIDYDSKISDYENAKLLAAISKSYDDNKQQYSAYTKDLTTASSISLDTLETLATDIYSSVDSVLSMNAIIRRAIVLDGLVGKTVESIFANCNTSYRLTYPDIEGRNKKKLLDQSKLVVEDFLRQINVEDFIRDAIPMTYCEGNRYYYLRVDGNNYVLDRLPLGICYMSDYNINGRPALEINIKKLESGLRKTYQSNKKRKAVWMKDMEDDIKTNYPYLYTAWKDGETYYRPDVNYAKAIRVNNLGRKFGVSPLAKVLKDVIVLDNISKADVATSKMKQRSIIVQTLRKEVLSPDGQKKGLAQAEYAHQNLMAALSTSSSVVTCPAFVEDIKYVSPPNEDNTKDKSSIYTRSEMIALGISFADAENSTGVAARIGLEELMKTVNAIAEQANSMLNDYFKIVLANNNIPVEYCPRIQIMDSKAMDFAMKKDLSDFLFNKLSCSYETAYEVLGIADYATEKSRRESEAADGIEKTFAPHSTAFNSGGSNESNSPGRPANENTDNPEHQEEDKVRYEDNAK